MDNNLILAISISFKLNSNLNIWFKIYNIIFTLLIILLYIVLHVQSWNMRCTALIFIINYKIDVHMYNYFKTINFCHEFSFF